MKAPKIYQIKIRGRLDPRWSDWIGGLTIASEKEVDGVPVTTITGAVADQAALRGILWRLWDMNLTIISVTPVEMGSKERRLREEGTMNGKPAIQVDNLVKEFKLGDETITAVDGVSMAVQSGEIVSIVGPSGSGKSTLLGLIGGLDSPSRGSVAIEGVEISGMNERELTNIRNEKLGFVFQFFNLISTLSALENVALPIQFARKRRFNPEKRARELLTHLGLGGRLNHHPQQLSGGEQQRVAIARALANGPPVLLADEPTGNLNSEASELVMKTIKQVHKDYGTTVVLVTHNRDVARQVERVFTLVDGKIL